MIEAMPRPRLPHLQHERTRHGKMVWYVRIGKGPRTQIRALYGTPEFLAQYHAAIAGTPLDGKPQKNTLAWLIARYRESAAWAALSSATRRQRELIFRDVIDSAGREPFDAITASVIRKGRERRSATPFAANNFLKAMRGLCGWAVEAEYLADNPAADVAFIETATEGHEPWTMDDVRRYEAQWPVGSRERVWLHVLLYTGIRLGDAVVVGKQHVRDGWVAMKAEKTGVDLHFPVFPALADTLATCPTGDMAWICNAYGRPFVKEAFGNAFRRAAREAGIVGKSAHGLRKTLASAAAEAGVTEEELKSFFGWTSNRMSAVYTRAASRRKLAGQAAEKIGNVLFPHLVSGAGEKPEKSIKSKREK